MAGHNKTILAGSLTKDPEHKQLPSGHGVCRLSLAIHRQFSHKGSLVKETCYIDVDVWGAAGESCKQSLQKGALTLVEGRLKLDSWEDQQGQKRSKHSIVADRVVFLTTQEPSTQTPESTAALTDQSASSDTIQSTGYNKSFLLGNLTRDPEHKQLPSGQAVCRLGLAVNRKSYNKQTASSVQEVCYIDVDVWGAQAETCKQFLAKGRLVLIEGRLKFDSWEDQQGQKRSKHSLVADRVIFLNSVTAAQDEAEEMASSHAPSMPGATLSNLSASENAALEQSFFSQINSIKSRNKATEQSSEARPAFPLGEIDYTDTPPFIDDLPF